MWSAIQSTVFSVKQVTLMEKLDIKKPVSVDNADTDRDEDFILILCCSISIMSNNLATSMIAEVEEVLYKIAGGEAMLP